MLDRRVLNEIWIYPIKSLPGIRVNSATVVQKGLIGDRRMMLIDETNTFISQRISSEMALFGVSMKGDFITIIHKPTSEKLEIDTQSRQAQTITAKVWDDSVEVVEMNPVYSSWLSDVLKMKCRLVFLPGGNKRRVDENYVKAEHHVSLADGYPILIIGKSSLDDLNNRIGQELSMKRFRPNLVFTGGAAYEEDGWKNFKIGEVSMAGVKPCGRCAIPTIDPETGKAGQEPTRTLATYRRRDTKVIFGENVIALNEGEIHEGDEIIFN